MASSTSSIGPTRAGAAGRKRGPPALKVAVGSPGDAIGPAAGAAPFHGDEVSNMVKPPDPGGPLPWWEVAKEASKGAGTGSGTAVAPAAASGKDPTPRTVFSETFAQPVAASFTVCSASHTCVQVSGGGGQGGVGAHPAGSSGSSSTAGPTRTPYPYACLTGVGQRKDNEDRCLIQANVGGRADTCAFAVFDGHGGGEAATMAAQRLPACLDALFCPTKGSGKGGKGGQSGQGGEAAAGGPSQQATEAAASASSASVSALPAAAPTPLPSASSPSSPRACLTAAFAQLDGIIMKEAQQRGQGIMVPIASTTGGAGSAGPVPSSIYRPGGPFGRSLAGGGTAGLHSNNTITTTTSAAADRGAGAGSGATGAGSGPLGPLGSSGPMESPLIVQAEKRVRMAMLARAPSSRSSNAGGSDRALPTVGEHAGAGGAGAGGAGAGQPSSSRAMPAPPASSALSLPPQAAAAGAAAGGAAGAGAGLAGVAASAAPAAAPPTKKVNPFSRSAVASARGAGMLPPLAPDSLGRRSMTPLPVTTHGLMGGHLHHGLGGGLGSCSIRKTVSERTVADGGVASLSEPPSSCPINTGRISALPFLSGTTAVVAVLEGSRAHVAHVGDSRAILVRMDGTAVALTEDHRPSLPREAERIAAAGGNIADGRLAGLLAVTRSLGDAGLRWAGLSAEPDVITVELGPSGTCAALVLATDGLWDAISVDKAGQIVMSAFVRDEGDGASGSGGGGAGAGAGSSSSSAPAASAPASAPEASAVDTDVPMLPTATAPAGSVLHGLQGLDLGAGAGLGDEPAPQASSSAPASASAAASAAGAPSQQQHGVRLPTCHLNAHVAAERLAAEATLQGSRDNITVLVVDASRVPSGSGSS